MCVSNTLTQTLCFIIFVTKVFCSRKYDIEAESMKLFKEDIKTALQHFRRTSEYMKILDGKNTEMINTANMITRHLVFHNMEQLSAKIMDMIGVGTTKAAITSTPASTTSGLVFRFGHINRRDDAPPTKSGVEILDGYSRFSSSLTLAERNSFKEQGFTYAGNIIHMLIKSLGSDDGSQSTAHPGGGGNEAASAPTEHVSVHVVTEATPEPTTTTTAAPPEAPTEAPTAGSSDAVPEAPGVRFL